MDFSEPYGTLVSASTEETQPRVWDLLTGLEIGQLRGHSGAVKCVQVENHFCLTGGEDGSVRIWDLRRVGIDETRDDGMVEVTEDGMIIRESETETRGSLDESCARVLDGHTKAVTALYFEDDCLV